MLTSLTIGAVTIISYCVSFINEIYKLEYISNIGLLRTIFALSGWCMLLIGMVWGFNIWFKIGKIGNDIDYISKNQKLDKYAWACMALIAVDTIFLFVMFPLISRVWFPLS